MEWPPSEANREELLKATTGSHMVVVSLSCAGAGSMGMGLQQGMSAGVSSTLYYPWAAEHGWMLAIGMYCLRA